MNRRSTRRCVRRAGFTLLEVLLVLAILGVIAAMVVPQLLGRQQEANVDLTRTSLKGLENAAKLYAMKHEGRLPQTIEEMMNPVDREGKPMKPFLDEIPNDAWGQPLNYAYEPQTDSARVWSVGPDGREGTEDDISNVKYQR